MNRNSFVNSSFYDSGSDDLWDDDANENMMTAFPSRTSLPSSSSSDGNIEEDFVCHDDNHHCSNQEESFEEHSFEFNNTNNYSIDNYSRLPSSPLSNADSDSEDTIQDASECFEPSSVIEKIEDFILQTVIEPLSEEPYPSTPEIDVEVDQIGFKRKLSFHHLSQARSLTSIMMVASFCHNLLSPPTTDTDDNEEEEGSMGSTFHQRNHHRPIHIRKTTTTREVYYFYVTHFRDQRECDKAIWDLVRILNLPSRQCLGLVASPKGWFCGSIDVYNAHTNELKFNGRELDSHGMAITPSTYDNPFHSNDQDTNKIRIESDARCIFVIEKEGIYTRLSEDKFFLRYFPCILVTGKGFPDIATRRWVLRMQRTLKIPVYGLCDCNPYGVSVLDTYRHHQGVMLSAKNSKRKKKGRRVDTEEEDSFEIEWIGLRPSQVEQMNLPSEVFQKLTKNDMKRLNSLLKPKLSGFESFVDGGRNKDERLSELNAMRKYKVELEALHWKGADYVSQFVYESVVKHESQRTLRRQKSTSDSDDDWHDEKIKSQSSYK